jgi:HEAT repeat protein
MPGLAFLAKVALIAIEGDVSKAGGVIRNGLTDRSSSVRAAAAEALRLVGPKTADVPALVKISRDGTDAAKLAAAVALGQVGPGAKDAVPRLIELLGDGDMEVRSAAAEALGRIGAPAAAPAIPRLKDAMRGNLIPPSVGRKALERLSTTAR